MGFGDVIVAGIVLTPLCYSVLLVAGKFGVGPLASYTSRVINQPTTVPDGVPLREGETVEYQIEPRRTRWRRLALIGVVLLPFGWGIPILVYAKRVRNRARYLITDERVIEETRDTVTSYSYADIGQIQTGANIFESVFNRGHVTFSINHRDLITMGWLHDPEPLRQSLDRHASV